jgi:GNAT superfamily N-acetyltransferase
MRTAYSPEWANGADVSDSRRIYQEMYARLSAVWMADGCLGHALTLMAHDPKAIDTWHWLGFGLGGVDGVRDLAPVLAATGRVDIRRAGVADVEEVMALDEALRRHLASAPTFLPLHDGDGEEAFRRWLGNPEKAEWLAYQDDQIVASMKIGPANENACYVIRGGGTASIVGAYTEEAARGHGIGSELLNRSLEWASREGYVRCAVDFEPHNIQAARFWPRYFEPVCYSLVRRVGEYAIDHHDTL